MKPAIHPGNLIPKLCFVLYGSPFEEYKDFFKKDLFQFLRSKKTKPLSRQAIKYWFDKGSLPNRVSSLDFLYTYFASHIERESLEPDKKKVFDQINAFFKKVNEKSVSRSSNNINTLVDFQNSNGGRFTYEVLVSDSFNQRVANELQGLYYIFHSRLVKDEDGDTAVEAAEIFTRGSELRFRAWYRLDNQQLAEFQGPIFVLGNTIWFIANGLEESNRLRIIAIRYVEGKARFATWVRTGVMLSDTPSELAPEPVSCRIALVRADENSSEKLQIMKSNAGALRSNELTGPISNIVNQLIVGSIEDKLVSGQSGSESTERLFSGLETLTVNQELAESESAVIDRYGGLGIDW